MVCLGFEVGNLLLCESVRLGDDGDDVHLVVQLLHELHVQRFQPVTFAQKKKLSQSAFQMIRIRIQKANTYPDPGV